MDFFFPEDNLNRATPEETKITTLTAQPYPDARRIRVNLEITPFQKRPYIEITLTDANNNEIAATSIVEPLSWKLELTMHIRGQLNNPYTLNAKLYYPEGPTNQPITHSFDIEPNPDDPQPAAT